MTDVLDSDGMPIRVGDMVERTDRPRIPCVVTRFSLYSDGTVDVHVDEQPNVHAAYSPSLLRHCNA